MLAQCILCALSAFSFSSLTKEKIFPGKSSKKAERKIVNILEILLLESD